MARKFGPIQGVDVGATFANRALLAASGVHRPSVAGICGGADGAESVVVSGGYEDDVDLGEEVIYTGHGGNEAQGGGAQVADQKWERGNAGLRRNQSDGVPVRLVRGPHRKSPFAPDSGYRYDGLYLVESCWEETGRSGYKICRFRLIRDDSDGQPAPNPAPSVTPTGPVPRRTGTIQRIVRNTERSQRVKLLHDYTCQACGTRLRTPSGPYAEGAHIRALGTPHNGPDIESNILCLCPNCHVLFDCGSFVVSDDFSLEGLGGRLRVIPAHAVGIDYIRYHRKTSARGDRGESR